MNKVCCFLVICCSGNLLAQTNSLSVSDHLFSTPQTGLRFLNTESNSQPQDVIGDLTELQRRSGLSQGFATNPEVATNAERHGSFEATSASGGMSGLSLQIYDRLEKGGYLTRPALPSEDRLDALVNTIFVPESIKFRKVSVSCSIVTAIKRKNLLPLLNPIFLDIRW